MLALVDDDPTYPMLFRRALKLEQLEPELQVFKDAEAADAYFAGGGEAALLVLDLNLPGMSGLELLKVLRGRAETARLPILLHSYSKEPENVAAAYQGAASGYIVKPQGLPDLRRLVRALHDHWLVFNETE
ncbi:MAG: response regulator [Candidatus Eremiobacteraeota bacterium]|nr:response regulator [Candidatus Eremiobacteraeota bacterium]